MECVHILFVIDCRHGSIGAKSLFETLLKSGAKKGSSKNLTLFSDRITQLDSNQTQNESNNGT